MAALPETSLPLYLRLGDTDDIHVGSLDFTGPLDEVHVDEGALRCGLAKALRLAAGRIENPTTPDGEPAAECGNHAPWPSIPARGCVRPAGHPGWHRSPGDAEWNWS